MSADRRSREQAADWAVRLADGAVDGATREACAAWCALHPSHPRLLADMRTLWDAATPQVPEPRPAGDGLGRRMVRGLMLLLLVPCLALGARALPWGYWLADQRTEMGEVRQVDLADGSRLTLNGNSAVDIDFSSESRRLRLRRGEVYVEVAKGSQPFVVVGRDGSVRALGTRYAVRLDEDDTLVTVVESRVSVRPRAVQEHAVELRAGEQVRFNRDGITKAVVPAAPAALAWQQGRLVFDDAPVTEVLREVGRYRPGLLLADEQSLRDLRFTGVLTTAQSDEALALLAASLPLRMSRLSPWLVRVSADVPPR